MKKLPVKCEACAKAQACIIGLQAQVRRLRRRTRHLARMAKPVKKAKIPPVQRNLNAPIQNAWLEANGFRLRQGGIAYEGELFGPGAEPL